MISAFSYGEPVLGVSELSRRLGLGKSTVHRILTTLADDGFVERTADDRYRLSLKMYEIGPQVAASNELRELVHPCLERLRNDSGETAHLAVLSGTDVVYLDRLESPQMLRLFTRVGRRRAAHATSSGKCLLAFGAPADLDRVRGRRPAAARAAHDHLALDAAAHAGRGRGRGYAMSVEEAAPGMVSSAAADLRRGANAWRPCPSPAPSRGCRRSNSLASPASSSPPPRPVDLADCVEASLSPSRSRAEEPHDPHPRSGPRTPPSPWPTATTALTGDVLLTGIQALVRGPIDQMRADRRAGLRTAGVRLRLPGLAARRLRPRAAANRALLDEHEVVHRPGLNEELGATAVMGSQLAATFASRRYDGVVGVWYGKAPGLDRAGDAIRHAQFAGTRAARRRPGPRRRRPGLQVVDRSRRAPSRLLAALGPAGALSRARCRTSSTSASTASRCRGPAACGWRSRSSRRWPTDRHRRGRPRARRGRWSR